MVAGQSLTVADEFRVHAWSRQADWTLHRICSSFNCTRSIQVDADCTRSRRQCDRTSPHVRIGSRVDGALARTIWRCCRIGRVRSRVRPVGAARLAAGPNALRGSGPNRKDALGGALTQAGSPDPRNDRFCITSSCPRQSVLPI